MGTYLQCSKNNIHRCYFFVKIHLCGHKSIMKKDYTLVNLPVYDALNESSPISMACFNYELCKCLCFVSGIVSCMSQLFQISVHI